MDDNCTCYTSIGTYKVCNISYKFLQVLCVSMDRINISYNKNKNKLKEIQETQGKAKIHFCKTVSKYCHGDIIRRGFDEWTKKKVSTSQ